MYSNFASLYLWSRFYLKVCCRNFKIQPSDFFDFVGVRRSYFLDLLLESLVLSQDILVLLLEVSDLLMLLFTLIISYLSLRAHPGLADRDFFFQFRDLFFMLFLQLILHFFCLCTISLHAFFVLFEHFLAVIRLHREYFLLSLSMPKLIFDLDEPLSVFALVSLERQDLPVFLRE